ncbi:UPF0061 protein [Fadolivirus algeromassiliense]|jgi:uncharacterized protein YdiU (UPF0061 family)|uniref:UPF0061 protein n=1 Tax=Fadolivirus FV1/VV64 TaxID=3070911 RepID=A0A7D3V643_9VIRU|nr:UPF0061 protein [Fadolivirus algeromassiliense]QKF94872.1 UPF0061 protein [Fadolivirus FV1/VV64]
MTETKSNKLESLSLKENCSWTNFLNRDPENDKYQPNRSSREVKSGHYVNVKPTPLPDPYMVLYSPDVAFKLGLDDLTCKSNEFLNIFSGNINQSSKSIGKCSWATPYALSIYGKEMYDNCPFKNGNGYGDGRAISISEILIDKSNRLELQLKGCGKTPFCRSGDGRAVIRSCIREFLVSEAMFHLNVPTTRALSVIASKSEKVPRQWYSEDGKEVMENSTCAVICRVAESFIRVGHIELYGRRVRDALEIWHASKQDYNKHDNIKKELDFRINELKMIVDYAIFREYPHLLQIQNEQEKYIQFLKEVGFNIANMTAEWLRVGYTQGNFNSDNCHIGGKTLDYGPFGFIELYDPQWNMWEGGGIHFAFMNQPLAGNKNFGSLVDAIIPLLDNNSTKIAMNLKTTQYEIALDKANQVWARKMGFSKFDSKVNELKKELFNLMEAHQVDFTIFWRQLAEIIENYDPDTQNIKLLSYIGNCFYKPLTQCNERSWIVWLSKWLTMIQNTNMDYKIISGNMKKQSPKFVPREWMLKQAYEKANIGDYSLIVELQQLFRNPYNEANKEMTMKYYRKMKLKESGNGTTQMSCSS